MAGKKVAVEGEITDSRMVGKRLDGLEMATPTRIEKI
jgi:hypothetical protein